MYDRRKPHGVDRNVPAVAVAAGILYPYRVIAVIDEIEYIAALKRIRLGAADDLVLERRDSCRTVYLDLHIAVSITEDRRTCFENVIRVVGNRNGV